MKQLLTNAAVFLFLSSFFVACGDNSKTASSTSEEVKPVFDIAAAKKAIEAINAEYAAKIASGDSAGLAAHYTSDAKAMPANMPATPKAELQKVFGEFLRAMGPMTVAITTTGLWGNQDLLSEEGTVIMSDKNGKQIDKTKYLALWKMEDGKWKIFRDCFNSDLPCQK